MVNTRLDNSNGPYDGLPNLSLQDQWNHLKSFPDAGCVGCLPPNWVPPQDLLSNEENYCTQIFIPPDLGKSTSMTTQCENTHANFPSLEGQLWRAIWVPELSRSSPEARGTSISVQIHRLSTDRCYRKHSSINLLRKFPFQSLFPRKTDLLHLSYASRLGSWKNLSIQESWAGNWWKLSL